MPITLTSQSGASAELLPERGGLLTKLALPRPRRPDAAGAATEPALSVLWRDQEFNATGSGWPSAGLPILFPFAGRVFQDGQPLKYSRGGNTFHMPLHGFAYALPWEVTHKAAEHAELRLTDSAATHDLYPFAFTLVAHYELSAGGSLRVQVRALNTGNAALPVAMGFHPYFKLPLTPKGLRQGCQLELSATSQTRVTPSGGAGKTTPFPPTQGTSHGSVDKSDTPAALSNLLPVADPLFASLILGGLKTPVTRLVDPASHLALRLTTSGPLSYIVLWTRADCDFHCIEPWMGLPDALNNGEGLAVLPPGASLTVGLELALERA